MNEFVTKVRLTKCHLTDSKPAGEDSSTKITKKLMHSQSFNTSSSQYLQENTNDDFGRNILKSTSLVLEIQNPILNHSVESERKVSIKEMSTNVVRDNCTKHNTYKKEPTNKKQQIETNKNEGNKHQQKFLVSGVESHKTHRNIDTNTIPPVRKTSSSTQTYFVNRSSVRKESNHITTNFANGEEDDKDSIPGVLNALDDLSRCIDEVIIESPKRVSKSKTTSSHTFKVREDFKREKSPQNILSFAVNKPKSMNQLDLLREILDAGELSEDSLKADEEVRAYMSADNEDDMMSSEWSDSWSRVKKRKENNRQIVEQGIDHFKYLLFDLLF